MDDKVKIRAIIWDFDGTLVDTAKKNLKVTRSIVQKITNKSFRQFTALQNIQNYEQAIKKYMNWRDMYRVEFFLQDEQVSAAGELWSQYQQSEDTPVLCYPGIADVLCELDEYPQGIVSMNAKDNIIRILNRHNILSYFSCIVGYEEVDIKRQKPLPDGILFCIKQMTEAESGIVVYIGDHETDAECAYHSNQYFMLNKPDLKLIKISALYSSNGDTSNWRFKPDYEAYTVRDIISITKQLQSIIF